MKKAYNSSRACSESKSVCLVFHPLVLLMLCGILVSACKPNKQKMGDHPTTNVPSDPVKAQEQSIKPKINFVATEKLYKQIKQKKLGSGPGLLRIDKNIGILIHPGTSPTEVIFDVSGMKEILKLAFWISGLPQSVLGSSNAGTAGFEVFVDGKSLGRKRVDRFTNETLSVDPKGVSKLRIVVDDDDGAQTCDWFFMGLQ